jgi:hypothetical protein
LNYWLLPVVIVIVGYDCPPPEEGNQTTDCVEEEHVRSPGLDHILSAKALHNCKNRGNNNQDRSN